MPNSLKEILQKGQVAVGAVAQLSSPEMVEIMGMAGFDFAMIDTEHGIFEIETTGHLIRAANGSGMASLVRVNQNSESTILKALDLGADGVIIPHVQSSVDVEKALQACQYSPIGRRGACPLIRANQFGLGDWAKYQREANESTMLIVLVEDRAGVDNIEDILSVEGLDVLFWGGFDLSVSSGYSGNVAHPEVLKMFDRVLAACQERSIPVMHTATNGPNLERWIEKGVRLVVQGAECGVFARSCKQFLESLAHLRNKTITMEHG